MRVNYLSRQVAANQTRIQKRTNNKAAQSICKALVSLMHVIFSSPAGFSERFNTRNTNTQTLPDLTVFSCFISFFPSFSLLSHCAAKNCSYFKHFTSGEEAEVFEVKTQKEYNISAAAIAIFSLFFMILGSLCVIFSFGKGRDYLLRPAGMFFAFAGLCIIISVEVMRQSVKRMIDSDETIWIEYYYSWSFTCACASFTLLILSGAALLLISMPHMPRNPWETCMDAEPDTLD
uniref:Voltage-dependent calcium channel gamma-1 subunit n=1 Tax=Amphiprion percula TaxID=161767 RepID=A0A3P8SMI2_AMPPE